MYGVFLDHASLDLGDLDLTPLQAVVTGLDHYPITATAQVAERIRHAEIVIVNKVVVDAAAIAAATRLRLICVTATGTNNIDLTAAARHGITVCNTRGYGTPSLAQHVMALILTLTTRLDDYRAAARDGRWQHSSQFCVLFPHRELAGKTLGIVGYGDLGRGVAHLAQAFGMRVLLAQRPGSSDPHPDRLPLTELLPQVDVLSLHCPLTPATRGLIGARELALLKPAALLINTARGGIVDEPALAEALRAGRLGGAGVDVLSEEPPRQGNPLLADDIPRLIVTPHSAWGSVEARQRIVVQTAENIHAFQAGQPRRVVT